jgi:hypothetical protein
MLIIVILRDTLTISIFDPKVELGIRMSLFCHLPDIFFLTPTPLFRI